VSNYGPYPATVNRVVDGDTLEVDVDLGFGLVMRLRCRLYGVNAPELKTPEGKAAAAYLRTTLYPGVEVTVYSHGWDKYGGRFDGTVYVGSADLSEVMVKAGHAVPRKY